MKRAIWILLTLTSLQTQAFSSITCGEGPRSLRVSVSESFLTLPEGTHPAKIENVPLLLSQSINLSIDPIFHLRHVTFTSAYCHYAFIVDSTNGGPYLFRSVQECEGQTRELSCQGAL